MITLTEKNIRLGVSVRNKEEAIRAAGAVLVETGAVQPAYVESMLGRESQANTYLGMGLSIPHGQLKSRELINTTAVSVIQIPQGVEWNKGQIAYLVVGIAARSDEHLGILGALTDVLDNPEQLLQLTQTTNPQEIIHALTTRQEEDQPPASANAELNNAPSVEVTLPGSAGLHARPATQLAELASTFSAAIQISYQGKTVNAKSMASLLKLGAAGGAVIKISADGADAEAALDTLRQTIINGLEEEDEQTPDSSTATRLWTPVSQGRAITGITAAPGITIGPVFRFQSVQLLVEDKPQDPATEETVLRKAIATAAEQISVIYESLKDRVGKNEAAIFHAHLALLQDTDLLQDVLGKIKAGHSAAWSWQQTIKQRTAELTKIDNERLAARAADWRDVGQRVQLLLSQTSGETKLPDHPVILIADDLTPSETARLDSRKVLGFCTASGGSTSHTAIIARSLNLPAVVGAGDSLNQLAAGTTCILDGSSGKLYIEPSAEDLKSAQIFQLELQKLNDAEYNTRFQPAILTDNNRVEIYGNIGQINEAASALESGAEGIGLLRTEFLFLDRNTPPTEDEQFAAYLSMVKSLKGLPLIIRTLDIGGDKVVPYLSLPKEENPFLGVRGIRLCLSQPEILLPQLRAVYRAAKEGNIRLMFPMVSTLEELRAAKTLAEQVRRAIGAPPVEIGMMIEVPSSALMAAEFAREVDFFSIGTNDLTQYTLAMDRLHAALAKNVDGMHPAVLRLVKMVVEAASAADRWVGVCGGIAGTSLGAAILTGIGIKELSMSLPAIPGVKAALRRLSSTQAKTLAQRALACTTAAEVRQLSLP